MKIHFACAAAVAILVCVPAFAATPVISGKYIITVHKFCEPTQTVHNSTIVNVGNFIDSVTLGGNDFNLAMYVGTFSPAKQTVSVSGFSDEGNLMLMQYTGVTNGGSGVAFQESTVSGKSSYSNTDTTVTYAGQTYNAFYGQIDKNGIAHYVTFQAIFTGENGVPCAQQGEASRQ